MDNMLLVRSRAMGNGYWIEAFENGAWQWIGECGDAVTAEAKRAEAESWRMAKVQGIW